jgi:hypothetical protein
MTETHKGSCLCGAVEIEVSGDPAGMGYCHCESCRHWSAGPVNAFTLWDPEKVRVVKGNKHLKQYNKTENTDRKWCDLCGGHVMAGHPGLNLIDVYAAVIPGIAFTPGLHVNYAETVLPMKDGLPKFRDFPADFGGSGDVVPE